MRRLPLRSRNRLRALALELLEERNAPTPMSVSAIASPAFGVSRPEEKQEPFSVRFGGTGSSSPSRANFGLNEPLQGGATPANHLQIAPGSGSEAFVQTASAPAPQTFVGTAALSGPQLFDNLEQNPLESFLLQINQRSTGGIPGDSVGPASSGGTATAGGGGAAVPGGGATAGPATGSPAASPSGALGGAGSGSPLPNQTGSATSASALGQPTASSPSSSASTASPVSLASTSSSPAAAPGPTAPTSGTSSPAAPTASSAMGPLITQASTTALVPILYANSANDPAREVVQVATGAQGGNPMTQGYSEAGVRYFDGAIQLSTSDLTSSGFGNPWGQTRNWTNATGYWAKNINGNGWVDSQMPYVQKENNGGTIVLITSGTNARFFDGTGPTYTERYFLQDTLYDNTSAQEFELTDDTGKELRLYDYSTGIPTAQQGTFKSLTDQFGNVTSVTAHTASGLIQEIQSSNTVGSTTVTESYLYTYITSGVNTGLLQNVTLRRQVNGGAWTNIRQVTYAYYDGTQSYGNAGDLQTATTQDGSGSTLQTWYYRYYVTESGGYQHALKYVFSPQAYARLVTAVGTPQTATDSQVSPYADLYLQFNSNKAVSQIVVAGAGSSLLGSNVGLGTYSYTYTSNVLDQGYNQWYTKTVETLNDGNTNTVYTNQFGEVMLRSFHDAASGNTWDWFNEFDGSGRIIVSASPSAITGFSDSYADLLHYQSGSGYQYLSNTTGLISSTDYYSSTTAGETTAGGVTGDEQDEKVQQGQQGTAITLNSTQYFLHTANSISVAPVANYTAYAQTNGSGGRTTSYSYTGSAAPRKCNPSRSPNR